MDEIRSLQALEAYYHSHRRDLPDPIDDLIYDILQEHTVRKVLSHSSNLRFPGSQSLSLALHFLPHLQRLDLPFGKIGDLGVKELAKVLPDLKTLSFIGLGSNDITPIGVFYLISAVAGLDALEGLDLSGNDIKEEGICLLSESITAGLSTIILRSCGLDIASSPGLRLFLSLHPRLRTIDIRFNFLSHPFHPGSLFKNNTSVVNLHLTGCKFDSNSLTALYLSLPCLPDLVELGIGYAAHSRDTVEILRKVIQPGFRSLVLAQETEKEMYTLWNPTLGVYLT